MLPGLPYVVIWKAFEEGLIIIIILLLGLETKEEIVWDASPGIAIKIS